MTKKPATQIHGVDIDAFTLAYIQAALWSTSDDNDEPLESTYYLWNIAPDTLKHIISDCETFQDRAQNHLFIADLTDEQAGHDFWLTRNGHGTGFWDRNLGEIGEQLTKLADEFGECDIYPGDDGQLYI